MTKLHSQRTCRACRKKNDKKQLIRMVILNNKVLEADPEQIMPGRGWYLCGKDPCLSFLGVLKSRQKVFGRGLELGSDLKKLMNPPTGGVHDQD